MVLIIPINWHQESQYHSKRFSSVPKFSQLTQEHPQTTTLCSECVSDIGLYAVPVVIRLYGSRDTGRNPSHPLISTEPIRYGHGMGTTRQNRNSDGPFTDVIRVIVCTLHSALIPRLLNIIVPFVVLATPLPRSKCEMAKLFHTLASSTESTLILAINTQPCHRDCNSAFGFGRNYISCYISCFAQSRWAHALNHVG
jgi:hypothetical protein